MAKLVLSLTLQPYDVKIKNGDIEITPLIVEQYTCTICGKQHPTLYTVNRVPGQPFGHFGTARLNNKQVVIDSTLPHSVTRLPHDAVRVADDLASAAWHSTGHYFTIPKREPK